jgi:hypothetical protein
LANLLRTDRARHRPMPNDSEQVEAIAVLARAHQDAVRTGQRDANRLRSLLREFFPAAVTAFPRLTTRSALTILAAAPTPTAGRALGPEQIRQLLRAARRVGVRASEVERLHQAFTAEQLHQPQAVEDAMGEAVRAIITTLMATQDALADIEAAVSSHMCAGGRKGGRTAVPRSLGLGGVVPRQTGMSPLPSSAREALVRAGRLGRGTCRRTAGLR